MLYFCCTRRGIRHRFPLRSVGLISRNGSCKGALRPEIAERAGKVVDVGVGMRRVRRDAQALGLHRYRRIVDRLDVDPVIFQKDVGDPLALLCVPHHHRHDVARVGHVRNAARIERRAHLRDIGLLRGAFHRGLLQVTDRGLRARRQGRRQRRREYEA